MFLLPPSFVRRHQHRARFPSSLAPGISEFRPKRSLGGPLHWHNAAGATVIHDHDFVKILVLCQTAARNQYLYGRAPGREVEKITLQILGQPITLFNFCHPAAVRRERRGAFKRSSTPDQPQPRQLRSRRRRNFGE